MRQRTFGPVGKKLDMRPGKKGEWHDFEKSDREAGGNTSSYEMNGTHTIVNIHTLLTIIIIFTFTINAEGLHPTVRILQVGHY